MHDYNDIVRLRTKVLILKDELEKATAEVGTIMGKYNSMEYLDEVNTLNSEIEALYMDVEDDDHYEEDVQEDINNLIGRKRLFLDSFELIEKLHADLHSIITNARVCLDQTYEKDMILRSLDEDLMQVFQ